LHITLKNNESDLDSLPSYLLKVFVLAILYFLIGKASFAVSQPHSIVTVVIFASEGIALAAVLIFGSKIWPGIFIGQLCLALSQDLALTPSLIISAINSLEAIIAFHLFNHFKLNTSLSSLRDVVGLFLLITFILQPFSATLGNVTLALSSVIQWNEIMVNWFSWWFGNTMGQILITPLLLIFFISNQKNSVIEFLFICIVFLSLAYILFWNLPLNNLSLMLSITTPIVVILAAYRGTAIALFATLILACVALFATRSGIGTFVYEGAILIVDLNFYILSHALLVLVTGVLFTERKAIEQKLKSQALYDALTGLPNRNLLAEQLSRAIEHSNRHKTLSAVCFIDLDGFKNVNDSLGHKAGDNLLRIVAQRLTSLVREEDSLTRLGGDEFLLITHNIASLDQIDHLMKRILNKIEEPINLAGDTTMISASIGISIYPDDSRDSSDSDGYTLISYADQAMYEAKNLGKNQFVFFDSLPKI
jgi:diguanylate cyclase (GGDEF)-like protein